MVRASAVHPRMRGERNQRCATPTTSIGSSPHARGTRFESSARHHALSVHPRMRGERMMTMLNPCLINGSSPHARGTPLQWLRFLPALRFIPACAGNARPDDLVMHPPFGSSPHARGTRRGRGQERHRIRFIPACAGNARESMTFSSLLTVHPRMRGEREVLKKRVLVIDGSSPHARGTQGRYSAPAIRKRFIPACAGNALFQKPKLNMRPVHPRMRGERGTVRVQPKWNVGSSPHARGTLERHARQTRGRSVHPRMRGERTSNKLLIYRRKSEPSDSTKRSGC